VSEKPKISEIKKKAAAFVYARLGATDSCLLFRPSRGII
jgi:hypothetical protein